MTPAGLRLVQRPVEAGATDVEQRLRAAASMLAETTVALLEPAIRDRATLGRLLELVSGLDHVGFLAHPRPLADLRRAAAAAGFDSEHRSAASTILAQELARLARRERMPTTIFRARGRAGWVEIFMPHGAPAAIVEQWIEHGVGAHVALRLRSGARCSELVDILAAEGFRIPEFMGAEEIRNPEVQLTALYFDRVSGPPLRLEFCR